MTKVPAAEADSGDGVGKVIAEMRLTNRLLALLATRGLDQRDAVLLLDVVGMSSQQIGELLGAKPSTVRVVLHRARKARGNRVGVQAERAGSSDGND